MEENENQNNNQLVVKKESSISKFFTKIKNGLKSIFGTKEKPQEEQKEVNKNETVNENQVNEAQPTENDNKDTEERADFKEVRRKEKFNNSVHIIMNDTEKTKKDIESEEEKEERNETIETPETEVSIESELDENENHEDENTEIAKQEDDLSEVAVDVEEDENDKKDAKKKFVDDLRNFDRNDIELNEKKRKIENGELSIENVDPNDVIKLIHIYQEENDEISKRIEQKEEELEK